VEGPGWPFFSGAPATSPAPPRRIRDFADESLPGVTVDDLGGGAEKHAHRQHCALRTITPSALPSGADEAVVLDDDGFGLQAAPARRDADASEMCTRLPDLRAGADVDQVSIMVDSST